MDERALQGLARLQAAGYLDQRAVHEVEEAVKKAEVAGTFFDAMSGLERHQLEPLREWIAAELYAWHSLTVAVSLGTTQAALDDFRRRHNLGSVE